jgi:ketosteroid isomerase-like protein
MNIKSSLTCFIALVAFAGVAAADRTTLAKEVRDAEQAFAATMVARDHAAFTRHLAEDAVFFDGEKPVRGKAAVATAWKAFFDGPNPPFSRRNRVCG